MGSKAGRIVLRGIPLGHNEPHDIAMQDGEVVAVTPAGKARADLGSKTSIIGPTLFDIQVNGANGIDMQGEKVTPRDVRSLTDFLATRGVSRWIPTLITGSQESMEHGCRVVAEARRDPVVRRAVPGVHIEGPYISPMDGPRGAHDRKHVRRPSANEFDRLMKAARGRIAYVTLAPEVEGAIPFIKRLSKRGVVVSIGHHNAGAEDIARAADAGARLCTHLGNGMAGVINRHDNPLWPQLANDSLMASIIADLEHLPESALKAIVRAKGPERTILVSDCVHIAGLKPGKYQLGGTPVEMLRTGRIRVSGTEFLGGSSLMLLQGVVNAAQTTDLSLEQAFACASTIPGGLFGLKHDFAPPTPGNRADLILFDIDKSQPHWTPRIRAVFIDGERKV